MDEKRKHQMWQWIDSEAVKWKDLSEEGYVWNESLDIDDVIMLKSLEEECFE